MSNLLTNVAHFFKLRDENSFWLTRRAACGHYGLAFFLAATVFALWPAWGSGKSYGELSRYGKGEAKPTREQLSKANLFLWQKFALAGAAVGHTSEYGGGLVLFVSILFHRKYGGGLELALKIALMVLSSPSVVTDMRNFMEAFRARQVSMGPVSGQP